ncbi:MAG: M15 family metallopeptidase [Actinomycetota bacterium]|nr:M15 family metallopeptidase [Actinomycetota bacterium]
MVAGRLRSTATGLLTALVAIVAGAACEPSPPPTVSPPLYLSVVSEVTAAELGSSWRPGCPVGPENLRTVWVTHHDMAGEVVWGSLVVHRNRAQDVVAVFEQLYDAGFPIARMEPVDVFGASDARSMAANNTSAFNCRTVAGTNRWSEHAYGRAIDINPIQNPWVAGDVVDPPAGEPYVGRAPAPGLIRDGDVVVRAFEAAGWGWGGHWSSSKDYQHFSTTGR